MPRSGEEQRPGEAAGHEPEREAGDDPRVERLEDADVEEHAGLADDEDEADRHHDRHQHEQGERDPARRRTSTSTIHDTRSTTESPASVAVATDASGRRRNAAASSVLDTDPGDRGTDVRHRQELGAVGREEDRARRDQDPRRREAEREPLPGQQEDRPAAATRAVARLGSRPGRLGVVVGGGLQHPRQRRDHAARDLRTVVEQLLERAAAEAQQQARLDRRHRGRSGRRREHRELADDAARAGLDQGPVADVDPDPALGDDEEPVLDAPRSMIASPASNDTSSSRRATATSVWPGTSPNNATRWSTATRSIVMSSARAFMPSPGRGLGEASAHLATANPVKGVGNIATA